MGELSSPFSNKGIKVLEFECEGCGGVAKIEVVESNDFMNTDISFCPFCAADISDQIEWEDDELEVSE